MATKIGFESGTCGRCGGSGNYSFCPMYGTTCFGCRGKGITLTKRGAKAAAAFKAHRLSLFGKPVETLEAGARVHYEGKFRTVASVTREAQHVIVEFSAPVKTAFGPISSHGMCYGTSMLVAESPEEWESLLVPFAASLVGATVNGEPSAATVKANAATAKRAATKAAKLAAASKGE